MTELSKLRVAILATNGFEESELKSPKAALSEMGVRTDVIAPSGPTIKAWKDDDWTDTVDVDRELGNANAKDYDALVLPGGVINPDQLRINADAMNFVRHFVDEGKVIAAICHGPWILINAEAVRGRSMTSFPSLRKDLENAGANWADQAVVTDNGVITSRNPDDLPAFNRKIIEELREGTHSRAA